MSPPPDDDLIPAISSRPKISPYRLLFFATTTGLGIAKAVLVSKNKAASSTTLEWITGVVVALLFQFLGSCEYNHTRPQFSDWLFSHESLGRLARAVTYLPHDPGVLRYAGALSVDHSNPPPVATGYRLLVSAIFTALGSAKMFCGYLGLSTAMNTLDWIIAIPLTLGLNYIGLYEDIRSNHPRPLFDVDYSPQVTFLFQAGFVLAVYLIGVTPCVLWVQYWCGALYTTVVAESEYATPSHGGWDTAFKHALRWSGGASYLLMIELGALTLGTVLWPLIKAYSGRWMLSIRHHALLIFFYTCYALAFVICIYGLLIQLSIAVPIYTLCLFTSGTESNLSLIMRMTLPLLVTVPTAVAWGPALALPIIFTDLRNAFQWMFLEN